MAQLKGEGTIALHRRTEVCICDVENNRKSTAPFRGWVVGGVGRKEAAVPLGLQKREDRSLCGKDWSPVRGGALKAQWGQEAGPHHHDHQVRRGLRHQLTMGSTSASRSRSSWISSVLPESLLATELGDGEFLQSAEERQDFQRAQDQEHWAVTPVKTYPKGTG